MSLTKPKITEVEGVTTAIKEAIFDDNGGGPFRAAPATGVNVLATLDDVSAGVVSGVSLDAGGGVGAAILVKDFAGLTSLTITCGLESAGGDGNSASYLYTIGTDNISGQSTNGDTLNIALGAGATLITGGVGAGVLNVTRVGTVLTFNTTAANSGHITWVGV